MTRPGKPENVREDGAFYLTAAATALVVVAAAGLWVTLWVASLFTGDPVPGPVAAPVALARGQIAWTAVHTVVAVGEGVVLAVAAGFASRWLARRHRGRARVDTAARHMATVRDLHVLSEATAREKIRTLEIALPPDAAPGVVIGRHVPSGMRLYGHYEALHLDIWGPRRGKSTSRVIPAIADAPGAVVSTSNKRDVVDATRGLRAAKGRVWVFDPQRVAYEEPTWWWDPLSYVTDDDKAATLASHFACGDDAGDAKKDPYFDPTGEELLAEMFLAAALAGQPITEVYRRLAEREAAREWVGVLRQAGYDLMANSLLSKLNLSPKQQDGVFGTAQKMARCLRMRSVLPWVTAGDGGREHFDADRFVAAGETLYSLSKDGAGNNAGPLVTALTVAVIEAAERIATGSAYGRIPTPMLCALDECANVVRWKELPSLFTHYGSRGIIIMAILQSYSQGVEVWGRTGMRKLLDAAAIFVYGGGSKDEEFLKLLSDLIGEFEYTSRSVSYGGGSRNAGGSTSRDIRTRTLLSVAHLQALDMGRAIVFAGTTPALVRTVPWWDGPHADAIRASQKAHDPTVCAKPAATEAFPI